MQNIRIRESSEIDLPAIQKIYAFYVLHGLSTFEEVPPTVEELASRRRAILDAGLPYLVATDGEEVVGYAYASMYRPRSAYRFTIEDSVYIRDGMHRKGIGGKLLTALIEHCEQGPWKQMIAVIGNSENAVQLLSTSNSALNL